MIGIEEKALMVTILSRAADSLGDACRVIDQIATRDVEVLRSSARADKAADAIEVEGPRIIKALREIIGRYER